MTGEIKQRPVASAKNRQAWSLGKELHPESKSIGRADGTLKSGSAMYAGRARYGNAICINRETMTADKPAKSVSRTVR
jgi:hypothetical protein